MTFHSLIFTTIAGMLMVIDYKSINVVKRDAQSPAADCSGSVKQ